VIEDGRNGMLVEPGDAEGLCRTLVVLLSDGSLRRKMGEEGRRRFQDRFEFAVCRSRLLKLYEDLLGRGRKMHAKAHVKMRRRRQAA
jgi:glycosyltransferase involved in cell wall biosynthesis